MAKRTVWFGQERSQRGDVLVGYALAVMLLAIPLVVGPHVFVLWSALDPDGQGAPRGFVDASMPLVATPMSLSRGVASIWLAALAGALGGTLHGIVSLTSYVGNQRFFARWTLWYLSRPINGGMTGGIFVAVLQGGLVQDATQLNVGGIVAMGAVAGLFSKQAVDRLRKVIEAFLGAENDHRDDKLDEREDLERDADAAEEGEDDGAAGDEAPPGGGAGAT